MRKISVCFVAFSILFSGDGLDAAVPSSQILALKPQPPGLFRSELGFEIHTKGTDWTLHRGVSPSSSILAFFRASSSTNGTRPALTVRADRLKGPTTLSRYIKSSMKDYPRFGFQVLAAKPMRLKIGPAFLIDSYNQETKKQIRQMVMLQDDLAIVLTCRDNQTTFATTVATCNRLMNNFAWINQPAPLTKQLTKKGSDSLAKTR